MYVHTACHGNEDVEMTQWFRVHNSAYISCVLGGVETNIRCPEIILARYLERESEREREVVLSGKWLFLSCY